MDFAELLPAQCPPADAKDTPWDEIYRLVPTDTPDQRAFKSHAALGKTPPKGMDLCRWSSCSLLLDVTTMKKLPQFKDGWVARISVPLGAGMSKAKKNHVDFWCGKDFVLTSTVLEVVKL